MTPHNIVAALKRRGVNAHRRTLLRYETAGYITEPIHRTGKVTEYDGRVVDEFCASYALMHGEHKTNPNEIRNIRETAMKLIYGFNTFFWKNNPMGAEVYNEQKRTESFTISKGIRKIGVVELLEDVDERVFFWIQEYFKNDFRAWQRKEIEQASALGGPEQVEAYEMAETQIINLVWNEPYTRVSVSFGVRNTFYPEQHIFIKLGEINVELRCIDSDKMSFEDRFKTDL